MNAPNLLFVCNAAQNRSRTAAEMYGGMYAGICSDERPVTEELLRWADSVCVFEKVQADWIRERFPGFFTKVVNLDLPDIYDYDVPILRRDIKEKMKACGVSVSEEEPPSLPAHP